MPQTSLSKELDQMALTIEAEFEFEKETKGALRYQEVDDKGVVEQAWAKVGTVYLRKSAFERGAKFPRHLKIRIECEGTVDGPTVA